MMLDNWIGRILLTNEEGLYNKDTGGRMLNLNYCDGSEVDETKYPLLAGKLGGDTTLPLMDAPVGSPNPYKIISDLYWYQIGDTLKSDNTKLIGESGTEEFDLLEQDGSEVDTNKYPLLAEKLPTFEEITELGTLTASDAEAYDLFGWSCAVYGDRLVVGAIWEDTAAVDGGKVYIYDWNGTNYDEVGTLTASDAQSDDRFGASCAVYGDRLVVGAEYEDTAGGNAGKVYYYDWNGTNYDEVGTLTASDAQPVDLFGASCAIYGDRLVVGAKFESTAGYRAGKVYIYDWNENTQSYDEVGTLTASDAQSEDYFGASCSVYGDRLVVGASSEDTAGDRAGKVYYYDWNENTQSYDEVGTLTASDAWIDDYFGASCSVYGDRLVVGAEEEDTAGSNTGTVYIYDWNGTSYDAVGTLTASDAQGRDRFGASCAIYGDRLVAGADGEDTAGTDAGKVYYYDINEVTRLPLVDPQTVPPTKIVADLT